MKHIKKQNEKLGNDLKGDLLRRCRSVVGSPSPQSILASSFCVSLLQSPFTVLCAAMSLFGSASSSGETIPYSSVQFEDLYFDDEGEPRIVWKDDQMLS